MTPTKDEFQKLIDECNKNRFSLPSIDINNLADDIYNALASLSSAREKAFKEFKSLRAYEWITVTNEAQYNRAMECLWPCHDEQARFNFYLDQIIDSYRYFKECRCADNSDLLHQSRSDILFWAEAMQEKERMIGHIANCFMNCLCPSPKENVSPVEFYTIVDKLIKNLENAMKGMNALGRYKDVSFHKNLSAGIEPISKELEKYIAIKNHKLFPVQRVKDRNEIRMFIVAVVRKFLVNDLLDSNNGLGYLFMDVLEFVMELLSFDCFDNPITEGNVRKIMQAEIARHEKELLICWQSHCKSKILLIE
ncbi:hypothetical protein [Methylobacter luteus]|uniref:hypothetical protein n=1 Tax=Methylobacter luteus TaxID=415 RepID=UPI0004184200|nr:hypothetical protein [Methylobacter luteus]